MLLAIFAGVLLRNYFNKIIVFQFLLAFVITFSLGKYVFLDIQYPEEWMGQPDDIEGVVFKKTPNIYIIQPDGYANFSEINKGYYQYNNSEFRNFLLEKGFQVYDNYRSNYYSTLSSNSSMFSMKHHYYNFPSSKIREVYNARNVIIGDNPVLRILNNNDYKTHLLLDRSYMLINRSEMGYDYCNMSADSLSYFSRGFQMSSDIFSEFKTIDISAGTHPNFFFLEELSPSHVTNKKSPGDIADVERKKYLNRLEDTNDWLKEVINYIEQKDPNGLIVITADHGGFVGMNTTLEARSKLTDRDLIYSIFTAQLAIKWPNNKVPNYDGQIKTPVNLFRILFSYLSENEKYLKNLQEDKSYIQIESGAPFGVYEYINEKGDVTFNRVSKN
ncbi:sulfatase-like hydrolase/transferase [Hanstruepera flava]|uniref:sulfatase-like hydrolase/transferase n=1 Tax=Hanstruepera flava TaxID=2930218 RepID=UPI0020293DFA|nr:sulfatase-like hydrolase/transferase [Hanstruepera flava]